MGRRGEFEMKVRMQHNSRNASEYADRRTPTATADDGSRQGPEQGAPTTDSNHHQTDSSPSTDQVHTANETPQNEPYKGKAAAQQPEEVDAHAMFHVPNLRMRNACSFTRPCPSPSKASLLLPRSNPR